MADPIDRVEVCSEHLRLMQAYHAAMSLYCDTLRALDLARPTAAASEYKRMAGYVEQCRLRSEDAKVALRNHLDQHGSADLAQVAKA